MRYDINGNCLLYLVKEESKGIPLAIFENFESAKMLIREMRKIDLCKDKSYKIVEVKYYKESLFRESSDCYIIFDKIIGDIIKDNKIKLFSNSG